MKTSTLVPSFLLMWFCVGSPVTIMLQKSKQTSTVKGKLRILSLIRDIIEIKSREAREVSYTCKYTGSRYLIPNLVMGID